MTRAATRRAALHVVTPEAEDGAAREASIGRSAEAYRLALLETAGLMDGAARLARSVSGAQVTLGDLRWEQRARSFDRDSQALMASVSRAARAAPGAEDEALLAEVSAALSTGRRDPVPAAGKLIARLETARTGDIGPACAAAAEAGELLDAAPVRRAFGTLTLWGTLRALGLPDRGLALAAKGRAGRDLLLWLSGRPIWGGARDRAADWLEADALSRES